MRAAAGRFFDMMDIMADARNEPMHYRLRPIESVQFRFDNLGSYMMSKTIQTVCFLLGYDPGNIQDKYKDKDTHKDKYKDKDRRMLPRRKS